LNQKFGIATVVPLPDLRPNCSMSKGTSDLAQNLMVSAKRSLVITGSSFIPQYLLVSLWSPDLRIRMMVHCNGPYMQFLTEALIKQECPNQYVSISIVTQVHC